MVNESGVLLRFLHVYRRGKMWYYSTANWQYENGENYV